MDGKGEAVGVKNPDLRGEGRDARVLRTGLLPNPESGSRAVASLRAPHLGQLARRVMSRAAPDRWPCMMDDLVVGCLSRSWLVALACCGWERGGARRELHPFELPCCLNATHPPAPASWLFVMGWRLQVTPPTTPLPLLQRLSLLSERDPATPPCCDVSCLHFLWAVNVSSHPQSMGARRCCLGYYSSAYWEYL